jgi:hypothetical protein
MKALNLALGPEWTLLELLCLGLTTLDEREMFEKLVRSSHIHWGEMLEQALRHKMLPMLAFNTSTGQLTETIPRFIKSHLRTVLALNKYKTAIFRAEAAKIIKELNEQSIRFVCTKGITLESTIYQGNGSRYFGDMDFMIAPSLGSVALRIISELGYRMGSFDWISGSVRPYKREIMAIYKLNPDHFPSLLLLINDPVVQYVRVDFATSLTWTRSPFTVPIETALAEIIYQPIPGIPDIQMPCFNPKFQFIFTILHLFREAWVFREGWTETLLSWETDVTLSKFADIIRLWRTHHNVLNTPDFIQTLEEYQIIDPILWVLEHTDRTFHTGIVPALGLEGRVTEEWLHSAGGVGGKRVQWKGTMRERLHCKDRRQLFLTDT